MVQHKADVTTTTGYALHTVTVNNSAELAIIRKEKKQKQEPKKILLNKMSLHTYLREKANLTGDL